MTAQIREAEATPPDDYRGGDWWQLLPEEAFVFAIEAARWPRMTTLWGAYEVLSGTVDPEDLEFDPAAVLAEQKAQAALIGKAQGVSGFQAFARHYAGLTFREAEALYSRMTFWNVRQGVIDYADEDS